MQVKIGVHVEVSLAIDQVATRVRCAAWRNARL